MNWPALETLPGYRRRFRITPATNSVCTQLEDDYHCMTVVVRHDGQLVTAVEPTMHRAPWTTCPGAEQKLTETFTGVALSEFAVRGEKTANCTHLYDLASLAAVHAFDSDELIYDILVADPIDGKRRAELRCNGEPVMAWTEVQFTIVEPEELKGMQLGDLRVWLKTLDSRQQEWAKLLRWGNMVANGRGIPLDQQSDATKMPAGCYTFQPARAVEAKRVGAIYDFSNGDRQPLTDIKSVF